MFSSCHRRVTMGAMPKTIDALTTRLIDAVKDSKRLLLELHELLPEPETRGPQTGTIGRHAPESLEPWNRPAADAYWNLWFGPGALVNMVRIAIGLNRYRQPPRGILALDELGNVAIGVSDDTLRYAVRKIEQWNTMALAIPDVGEADRWVSIKSPGGTPPACPYCHTYGLRMQLQREQVRCFFPGCTDSSGLPTVARVERGRLSGEPRLVFGDGTLMHWRDDDGSDSAGDPRSADGQSGAA